MFYDQSRQKLRMQFFNAWQKFKQNGVLTPLEAEITAVIQAHPEYHSIIENPSKYEDKDFTPEMGQTNPFLHLSLHLAINDQIKTDRPKGIRRLFEEKCKKNQTIEQVEHQMMEILAETIWQTQRYNQPPIEIEYLNKIKNS